MAPLLELPYEMHNVTPEEDKIIKKCLVGYTKPFMKCGKKGYVMPEGFKKHAEAIYNMKVRPDDIWVITFPRSGTTWTQEMVWLLENGLDYATAKKEPLFKRFPMVETTTQIPDIGFPLIKLNFLNLSLFQGLDQAVRTPSWKSIEDAPSPRFIKTHLPLSLLPPSLLTTAKVIYVARDPRDVAVSYYYLHKMIAKSLLRASFSHFWEAFRRDLLPWTPIIEHNNEAFLQRHNKNLHFLFYEDMLKVNIDPDSPLRKYTDLLICWEGTKFARDLPKVIRGVCGFLNRDYSDNEINQLAKYLSFDNLKKNKKVNNNINEGGEIQFIRKGEAGGWRTLFDEKMEVQAETFFLTKLKGLKLKYPTWSEQEWSHL